MVSKINRRGFLTSMSAAPAAIAATAAITPIAYHRVSVEAGDPGEAAFAALCAQKKRAEVFLDGVYQKWALTADAKEGWVRRHRIDEFDNVLFNPRTGKILNEVVYGSVVIEIKDGQWR